MIDIIDNISIVLLYLAVFSILIYAIYLILYNWYIEKRLNKKIKKLRVFEPIKVVHFASIPLVFLYLVSQTVMMISISQSNKDALNILKSYTPVIEDVYVQKNVDHAYVSMHKDIFIEIELSMDHEATYNNQISFPSVVLKINDFSYEIKEITYENRINLTGNSNLYLKVPFPESLKSEGVYNIHLKSLDVYYIEHKTTKRFDLNPSAVSIELIDAETYQLDFIIGDIVLSTIQLEVGKSLIKFWYENPNHQIDLEQRVDYYVTYLNELIPGINIHFNNIWKFNGDVLLNEVIFGDYEVYPEINNYEQIPENLNFVLNTTAEVDNPYRNNDLKVSIDEVVELVWKPHEYSKFSYITSIKSDSNEYIEIIGLFNIKGLKPGLTEIVVEVNLGFLIVEKTIEIEVIPYKAFVSYPGDVVYLKYDINTNKIIEPLSPISPYVDKVFNIESERYEYSNATGVYPNITEFFIIKTKGRYDYVFVIYDTTFSKDIIKIEHDTYNPLTNTLTITEESASWIKFDIDYDLLTAVEKQFFRRPRIYLYRFGIGDLVAGNTYSVTLYMMLDGYYTIGKVINVEVI